MSMKRFHWACLACRKLKISFNILNNMHSSGYIVYQIRHTSLSNHKISYSKNPNLSTKTKHSTHISSLLQAQFSANHIILKVLNLSYDNTHGLPTRVTGKPVNMVSSTSSQGGSNLRQELVQSGI